MRSMPKYVLVKEDILKKIQNGELRPDDKLPSEDAYAKLYNVSNITIKKALAELVADGYICRIKGKGSFVNALNQQGSSSNLIALILSAEDYYDISYMQIVKGAQKIMSEHGYSLIVEWSNADLTTEREIILKMISQMVDGLLIYPFDPVKSASNYALIEEHNIPYILIDRYNPKHPSYFVGCDNYGGALQVTNELIKLKHTKIRFAAYHFFLSSEQERFDGYCNAMRQANLKTTPENVLTSINYALLAEEILRRETTAIVCCNDKLAIKLIDQLSKYGVRVPEDVSVFGFDDWATSQQLSVKLSTVRQNFSQIGSQAAHLLLNAIQDKSSPKNTKLLTGVELVMRDTVCQNPYSQQ